MKQDNKKRSDLAATDDMAGLKDQFAKEKNTPLTRKVILVTESCCGCGCSDVRIKRVVPYDSPLKDGDRVDSIENGDRPID